MEFLLTYGWAIIAVLTAIFALSYYGVLDVSKYFAHETCTMEIGLSCLDSSVVFVPPPVPFVPAKNDASIVIKNNLGHDIEVMEIKVQEFDTLTDLRLSPEPINNDASKTFLLTDITGAPIFSAIPKSDKYALHLSIIVSNTETKLEHTYHAELIGRVG